MPFFRVLVCWAALCGVSPPAIAADSIEIRSVDGHVLRGVIDARTDSEHIWVRQENGAIIFTASMRWDAVAAATLDGADIDVDQLRNRSAEFETMAQRSDSPGRPWGGAVSAARAEAVQARRLRVRSLEIVDVCVANLDRDVEPDGLIVSVAAIGDDGRPMPVRGSLQVRLFAERRPADIADVSFELLDDWSEPVSVRDFVDGVATFELRFRRAAPEWQFDLLPDALIEARLGAFGYGNYAASAPVVIRPFNPLRDNRQLVDGTRFLPRELHGRNPVSAPSDRRGLWLHWTR